MPTPAILIVDDDQRVREVFGKLLADAGYRVETVNNGPDALERIAQGEVSLVLLDITFAGDEPRYPDGLGVIHHLRAKDSTKDVPVIVLTGTREESDAKAFAREHGVEHYFIKHTTPPFAVVDTIRRLVPKA